MISLATSSPAADEVGIFHSNGTTHPASTLVDEKPSSQDSQMAHAQQLQDLSDTDPAISVSIPDRHAPRSMQISMDVDSSDVDSRPMTRDGSGMDERQSSDLSEPPTDLEDNPSVLRKPESGKKKHRRRLGPETNPIGSLDPSFLGRDKRSAESLLAIDRSKKIKISSPAKQRPGSAVDLGVLPSDAKLRQKNDVEVRTRTRDDDLNVSLLYILSRR
jgi:hypothetical protein